MASKKIRVDVNMEQFILDQFSGVYEKCISFPDLEKQLEIHGIEYASEETGEALTKLIRKNKINIATLTSPAERSASIVLLPRV